MNAPSGEGASANLSEIMHQIDKKLDSAQRKFNPQFGKNRQSAVEIDKINEFDVDFEKEVEVQRQSLAVRRSATTLADKTSQPKNATVATTKASRKASVRNPKTPSTMERTGTLRSSANYEDEADGAFTPE